MNIVGGIVLYVILWWVVFFTLLPVGVQSDEEAGEETLPGTVSSAPVKHNLGKKALAATGIAVLVWLPAFWAVETYLIPA